MSHKSPFVSKFSTFGELPSRGERFSLPDCLKTISIERAVSRRSLAYHRCDVFDLNQWSSRDRHLNRFLQCRSSSSGEVCVCSFSGLYAEEKTKAVFLFNERAAIQVCRLFAGMSCVCRPVRPCDLHEGSSVLAYRMSFLRGHLIPQLRVSLCQLGSYISAGFGFVETRGRVLRSSSLQWPAGAVAEESRG